MRLLIFGLFMLFAAGCSYTPLVSEQGLNESYFFRLSQRIQRFRGIKADGPIRTEIVETPAAMKVIQESMEAIHPDDELKSIEFAYQAFGLLPPGANLKTSILQLLEEQAAGFYDMKSKILYVVRKDQDLPFLVWLASCLVDRDLTNEMVVGHEITHALQDQQFDLAAILDEVGHDDDQALAALAVIEGDATLTSVMSLLRSLGQYEVPEINREDVDELLSKDLAKAFPVLRETLIFPYITGTQFHIRLLEASVEQAKEEKPHGFWRGIERMNVPENIGEDDWEVLNVLDLSFQNMPRSTEQILHPDKFFVQPDVPSTVRLPGLAILKESQYKLIRENVFGELVIRVLLGNGKEADRGAAGWDGDRYRVYKGPGGKPALVWASVWDSDAQAREFVRILSNNWLSPRKSGMVKSLGPVVVVCDGFEKDLCKQVLDETLAKVR